MTDTNTSNGYLEISLEVPRDLADAVCNFVIENICSGLVLEEEEQSEITGIKFYLPENDTKNYTDLLNTYFASLLGLGTGMTKMPRISEKRIQSAQWEEEYRQSVKPIIIAGDVVVRPPWERVAESVRYDIIIEPRMAFGTGSHESTKGCLEAIRAEFKSGMRFLDMGCGSGILSILADRMEASYIKAIDYDILAVENCGENFLINQLKASHNIIHGSIEACENDSLYDFVCVNIIRETIVSMLDRLESMVKPGGVLVLSGLLDQDQQEVEERLTMLGLTDYRITPDNEWRTFVIRKG